MICPKCGADTIVVDSRRSDANIKRRRKCLRCGNRFSTMEIDLDVYTALSAAPDADTRLKWKLAMENIRACVAEILE